MTEGEGEEVEKELFTFPKDVLFTQATQAASPLKDWINIQVDSDTVQFTRWKIDAQCLRVGGRPSCRTETHEDFLDSFDLQNDIKRIFSKNVLTHINELCKGNYNYLCRVSDKIKILIMDYLELEDLMHLAQTNKAFHKLCNSETVWERFVRMRTDTITKEMKDFAANVGWKRVFFTNKLQLRAQIRRHQKSEQIQQQQVFLTAGDC